MSRMRPRQGVIAGTGRLPEVSPQEVRDLVTMTGEARALLPVGQPVTGAHLAGVFRQRAAFAGLPENAIAVNADGTYMTVPSGIGVLEGMDSPQFFRRDGEPLGQITLMGVRDRGGEASLWGISNDSDVRRTAKLALWYLAAHTAARTFTVYNVVNDRFACELAELGMVWSNGDMMGDAQTVARLAAEAAVGAGWTLRGPVST